MIASSTVRFLELGLGQFFVAAQQRQHILPSESVLVDALPIKRSLVTKFYPGIFHALGFAPSRLGPLFERRRIPAFCVAPGNWAPQTIRLEDHPTWTYVHHALAYARSADFGHVEAVWRFGQEAWRSGGKPLGRFRRVTEFKKVATNEWSQDDAKKYIERIVGLANLVEQSSSVPESDQLSNASGRVDRDIGIAIDSGGNIIHFRKGHHRLMIAKQLGIDRLRVSVELVHADWLLRQGISAKRIWDALEHGSDELCQMVQATIAQHVGNFNKAPI